MIHKVESKHRRKCSSCGETIRKCEPSWETDGCDDTYCVGCERIARMNDVDENGEPDNGFSLAKYLGLREP